MAASSGLPAGAAPRGHWATDQGAPRTPARAPGGRADQGAGTTEYAVIGEESELPEEVT